MGEVWEAQDSELGRRVAVKILRAPDEELTLARMRFSREARAAAVLRHPNIVVVHDAGEAAGTCFIVMELVEGRTLRDLVGKDVLLADKVRWLTEIADALGAMHGAGIVHRDVKPENVIVRANGTACLVDLGIAKWKQASAAPTLDNASEIVETADNIVIGTPDYLPPEAHQAGLFEERGDQFAWAITAYEILAGKHPLENGMRPLTEVVGIPAHVAQTIERARSNAANDRFATMVEVARALAAPPAANAARVPSSPEAHAAGMGQGGPPSGGEYGAPGHPPPGSDPSIRMPGGPTSSTAGLAADGTTRRSRRRREEASSARIFVRALVAAVGLGLVVVVAIAIGRWSVGAETRDAASYGRASGDAGAPVGRADADAEAANDDASAKSAPSVPATDGADASPTGSNDASAPPRPARGADASAGAPSAPSAAVEPPKRKIRSFTLVHDANDHASAAALMNRGRPDFDRCVEARPPSCRVKVTLSWALARDGTTGPALIRGEPPTCASRELGACLDGVMRRPFMADHERVEHEVFEYELLIE